MRTPGCLYVWQRSVSKAMARSAEAMRDPHASGRNTFAQASPPQHAALNSWAWSLAASWHLRASTSAEHWAATA